MNAPIALRARAAAFFRLVGRRRLLSEIGYLAQAEADALLFGDRNQWPPKVPTDAERAEAEEHLATMRAAWAEADALPSGASEGQRPDPYAELQDRIDARSVLVDDVARALLDGAILLARRHSAGPLMGAIFVVLEEPHGRVVEVATEADDLAAAVACPTCGRRKGIGCVEAVSRPRKGMPREQACSWHPERVAVGRRARPAAIGRELGPLELWGSLGTTIGGRKVHHAGKGYASIDGGPAMHLSAAIPVLVQAELRWNAAWRIAAVFVGERGAGIEEARVALDRWLERRELEAA